MSLPWRVISKREEALQADLKREMLGALQGQIDRANAYIVKLENLLDHERQRVSDEQERADRANDALLQQNGVAAVSGTVRREYEAKAEEQKEAAQTLASQLAEIYRENGESFFDDLGRELPPEFQEAADELMKKNLN